MIPRLRESTCHIWPGAKDTAGYGLIVVDGKNVYLHRMACELHHGPALEGAHALHSCDTPACCNPAHIRWGTPKENQRDRTDRNRHNGKLSYDDAVAIRTALACGTTGKALAALYAVSTSTISLIRSVKRWPV